MTICDVCENREPTTRLYLTTQQTGYSPIDRGLDLCSECHEYATPDNLVLGMKELRAREQPGPVTTKGELVPMPSAPPETEAYWRCVCPQCGSFRISHKQPDKTNPVCRCGYHATWEKVEPATPSNQPPPPPRLNAWEDI